MGAYLSYEQNWVAELAESGGETTLIELWRHSKTLPTAVGELKGWLRQIELVGLLDRLALDPIKLMKSSGFRLEVQI